MENAAGEYSIDKCLNALYLQGYKKTLGQDACKV